LHGMEQAAGVRYIPTGSNAGTARAGSPVVIRYADDLLALCHSREQAEQVKARLARWLEPRGLAFNEDKTRVVHIVLLTELRSLFSQVISHIREVAVSLPAWSVAEVQGGTWQVWLYRG